MAEDKARSSGTPEDVLERVKSHDFLVRCLRKAKFSADLLQDTVDACEINDLNALVLGSGLLSVSEASEQLFLMTDEASTVVEVCRKECLRAGVNFGDGAKLTPEELAEADVEPEPLPAAPAAHQPGRAHSHTRMSPGKTQSPAAILAQANAVSQPAPAAAPAAAAPAAPAAVAAPFPSTPAPAAPPAPAASAPAAPAPAASPAPQQATPPPAASSSSATHADHPDPNFLIKPPVAASAAAAASTPAAATPHSARHSHIPRPAAATPVTPAAGHATPRERPAAKPATRASPSTTIPTPTPAAAAPTPSMNGKHTPAAGAAASSASSSKPPRPGSAPLSARGPAVTPHSTAAKERPASAVPTQTPPARLPSYARATASHKARLLKEDTDVPSTSTPPPPVTFASTAKPLRRNFYSMPRPASATPEEKKEPKKPIFDNIRSSLLRPTAAFLAWTAGKSKASKEADLKTSQTLQAESSKSAKGSSPAVTKSVSGAASSPGAAGAKAATPEPFRLASMERHQKAQEELARKREEKARLESNIPKFKATPAPSVATGGVSSASKTSPKRTSAAQTEVSPAAAVQQP